MSNMTIDLESMPPAFAHLFQRAALGVKRRQHDWVLGSYTRCGKELDRRELRPTIPEALRCASIIASAEPEAELIFAEMYLPATAAIFLSKVKIRGERTVVVQLSSRLGTSSTAVLDPTEGVWLDCPDSALSSWKWVAQARGGKDSGLSYQ